MKADDKERERKLRESHYEKGAARALRVQRNKKREERRRTLKRGTDEEFLRNYDFVRMGKGPSKRYMYMHVRCQCLSMV